MKEIKEKLETAIHIFVSTGDKFDSFDQGRVYQLIYDCIDLIEKEGQEELSVDDFKVGDEVEEVGIGDKYRIIEFLHNGVVYCVDELGISAYFTTKELKKIN